MLEADKQSKNLKTHTLKLLNGLFGIVGLMLATETCYGMRQLDGNSFISELWIVIIGGFVFLCRVSIQAPGRGVPRFLAGFALALLLFSHDPVYAQLE